jgi:hypothetical protein
MKTLIVTDEQYESLRRLFVNEAVGQDDVPVLTKEEQIYKQYSNKLNA